MGTAIAEKQGLRLLKCPANKISFAADLTTLAKSSGSDNTTDFDHLTFIGSALFTRRVSGPRVVLCTLPASPPIEAPEIMENPCADATPPTVKVKGKYRKVIDGIPFESYGAHADTYPCCYLTAACAIGVTRHELEIFLERFENALQDYKSGAGRKENS